MSEKMYTYLFTCLIECIIKGMSERNSNEVLSIHVFYGLHQTFVQMLIYLPYYILLVESIPGISQKENLILTIFHVENFY